MTASRFPPPACAVAAGLAAIVAVPAIVAGRRASAQTFQVERPLSVPVGAPAQGARMVGLNAARTGVSAVPLPTGPLGIGWRLAHGLIIDHPPVVDSQGRVTVVGDRGDVVTIAPSGEVRWRLSTGFGQPGPSALLSDDTVVFVGAFTTGVAEAVGVRDGAVRWHTRLGRASATYPAPLPLADGGVVVATPRELAVLDADGQLRTTTLLPEPVAAPPVATSESTVAVVAASGVVYEWDLAARAPVRVGRFARAVDGAAAWVRPGALIAVEAGGAAVAIADRGADLGASWPAPNGSQWLGPPRGSGRSVFVLAAGASGEIVVALDPAGGELGRTWIGPASGMFSAPASTGVPAPPSASAVPARAGDAGVPGPVVTHAAPLVDPAGTLVVPTGDGAIAIVVGLPGASATVERLDEVCPTSVLTPAPTPHTGSSFVGIAPLAPGKLVAVCRVGAVVEVEPPTAARGRPGEPGAESL